MEVYRNAGRKPTGLLRNKMFSFRLTEDERTELRNFFKELQSKYKLSSQSEVLIKLVEEYKKTQLLKK